MSHSALGKLLAAIMIIGGLADPAVKISLDPTGTYTVSLNGKRWYSSPAAQTVCINGTRLSLAYNGSTTTHGDDHFGSWSGVTASYTADGAKMLLTFQHYPARPELVVGMASFPSGLNTANCGSNTELSTNFPAFDTTKHMALELNTVSWRGQVIGTTAAAKGLGNLGANGLDCGPVVSTDAASSTLNTLVWSSLDSHKILPQQTKDNVYAMGIAAAVPTLPPNYSYSVIFHAAAGGVTAGMYSWGEAIQAWHNTTRLPSVTLSDIGYYTDDGAYYYVWGGGKERHDPELSEWIPPRPWPAEEGLILVKEALYAQGVPIAYMQLDDWWYQGPFFFGNVSSTRRCVFRSCRPSGDIIGWDSLSSCTHRSALIMSVAGTKLVVPDDSYGFFSDTFDLGKNITNGRFSTYEIDFLDSNFQGCKACFDDVNAAHEWYKGMAQAALERNISIQYCLPSATDMLESLAYPAVVQARASGDYARPQGNLQPWGNVVTLGGASLLLGATAMAPSKDTLWTASPQPPTSSDRTHSGVTTQPHAILATLSLGPVGISDGLNQTDVSLISQAYRSSVDSTILRPSRPLSTVDAVFSNQSSPSTREIIEHPTQQDCGEPCTTHSDCTGGCNFCSGPGGHCEEGNDDYFAPSSHSADVGRAIITGSAADVRATHASLEHGGPNSHYVVCWMTTSPVTLQSSDLFPMPAPGGQLAFRKHIISPTGDAQFAGCTSGEHAHPNCITVLTPGEMPTLPAVGTHQSDITAFGLWAVYEKTSNGAYFLGELEKFVHVSPQRFDYVLVQGKAPCGLKIGVKGSHLQSINLVAVDPEGIVHRTTVVIPSSGMISVEM